MTAQAVDSLVLNFGIHIENKLQELDPVTHRPRYTLKQLLTEPPKTAGQINRESFLALRMLLGGSIPPGAN